MSIYIALVRGINVGGKNKVKMADLKRVFASLGLAKMETYIQSGNVLFEAAADEDPLRHMIERGLAETLGIPAAVILRTAGELERLIRGCPFSAAEIAEAEASNPEGECCYVNLLARPPAPEKTAYLHAFSGGEDRYLIQGRDMYLLFYRGIRNSKLAGSLQKLDAAGTVRNWKTLNRLLALAQSRPDTG